MTVFKGERFQFGGSVIPQVERTTVSLHVSGAGVSFGEDIRGADAGQVGGWRPQTQVRRVRARPRALAGEGENATETNPRHEHRYEEVHNRRPGWEWRKRRKLQEEEDADTAEDHQICWTYGQLGDHKGRRSHMWTQLVEGSIIISFIRT